MLHQESAKTPPNKKHQISQNNRLFKQTNPNPEHRQSQTCIKIKS